MRRTAYPLVKWTARIALVGMVLAVIGLLMAADTVLNCYYCRTTLSDYLHTAKYDVLDRLLHEEGTRRLWNGTNIAFAKSPMCKLLHPDRPNALADTTNSPAGDSSDNKGDSSMWKSRADFFKAFPVGWTEASEAQYQSWRDRVGPEKSKGVSRCNWAAVINKSPVQ
jgi:hypothetical protein